MHCVRGVWLPVTLTHAVGLFTNDLKGSCRCGDCCHLRSPAVTCCHLLSPVAARGATTQRAAPGARTATRGYREATQSGLEAAPHGTTSLPHQVLQVRTLNTR
jgi:hypothetical protein